MSSTNKGQADIWPTGVPADAQHLISLYFALVDSKDAAAGPRLADDVFARDGRWFAAAGCFEGHDSIARSREKAWDAVESQCHEVTRVFVHDAGRGGGLDLLLAGVADIQLKSKSSSSERIRREFLVRAVLSSQDEGEGKSLRIRFWQPVLSKPSPSDQPILADVEMSK